MEHWVLAIQVLMSLYMFGLIWFVQVVHYPLFAKVGAAEWVAYEQAHTHQTSFVTAPFMIVELGTAAWIWWFDYQLLENWWNLPNLLIVLALWASTFFIQVPLHNQLLRAHSAKAIQRLVNSNWIRTGLWTGKAIVWMWLVFDKLAV